MKALAVASSVMNGGTSNYLISITCLPFSNHLKSVLKLLPLIHLQISSTDSYCLWYILITVEV